MRTTILCLTFVMLAQVATAAVIDAPHNGANYMGCATCRSYSVWWQYSPVAGDPVRRADTVNTICLNCHGDSGPEIAGVAHASVAMGSLHRNTLADWSRV